MGLHYAHFARMPFFQGKDLLADIINKCSLGLVTHLLQKNEISQLIEQFWMFKGQLISLSRRCQRHGVNHSLGGRTDNCERTPESQKATRGVRERDFTN